MSISANEIIFKKATVNDDTTANGGLMSTNIITSGVKNNLWPDVPQSERQAGSTKYRKVFIHVASDTDLALIRPRFFIETATPGDDRVTFFPPQSNPFTCTANTIGSGNNEYGTGLLNTAIAAGATTLEVFVESPVGALDSPACIFRDGGLIRISNKTSVLDTVGTEDYVSITNVDSIVGNVVHLTVPATIAHAYAANGVTKVASVYDPGVDIIGTVGTYIKTGLVLSTFDQVTYPVKASSKGSIYQKWTITVLSGGTTYSVTGDGNGSGGDVGLLATTGTFGANFAPVNASASNRPYFNLDYRAWGGTHAAGDTMSFITSPSAVAIWEKRIIPAGASSLSGNRYILAVDGESE